MDLVIAIAVAVAAAGAASIALGVWLIAVRSRRPGPRRTTLATIAAGGGLVVFGLLLARAAWAFWDRPVI